MFILNEEDIPHILLNTLKFNQHHENTLNEIFLSIQNVVNDNDVRDVKRELRKCVFPDELTIITRYKYYSYSVCVTECLKQAQIMACNCTHHNMIYDGKCF